MKKQILLVLFAMGLFGAFLPTTVSAATPTAAQLPQVSLSVTVTSVKNGVIKVSTSDRKTYTLVFAAKVSFVDETGKNLTLKQMRVGDSLRLSGTLKGVTFTAARGRRASSAAVPAKTP